MFPQAVPRLVFGLALLWAWLGIGRLPHLRHPVAAGAGLFHRDAAARRAHAGGRGAADRQEPGGMRARLRRVLGLPDAHRHLAAAASPAIVAAWLLIFMACVRELGASVFLMGPNAKVIAPSIVNASPPAAPSSRRRWR